ncbi:hypothetical protein L917_20842 [Phytophthora nicotianae]|uniref:Uncharacterized protein n=1 Tax=Phytophthora nicotianae TaxID=4792 RepID=W2JZI1_PHYNI|nr:hypothetical protein L917_20842 [Phytophthora nicotianae]
MSFSTLFESIGGGPRRLAREAGFCVQQLPRTA